VLRVDACATLQELNTLRAEWEDLMERSTSASIFSTWEWVEANWRYTAPGKEPFVLQVRNEEGRLVALMPLARTSRWRVLKMVEVLGCNSLGYPMGDYGGLMAARGVESAAWYAVLKYLKSKRWSIIDLRNCKVSPGEEAAMERGYSQPADSIGFGVRVQVSDVCRVVPLPSSYEEYMAGLSSNARQNIRRKLRKLAADGHSLAQVDARDEQARGEALEALFSLHQARWGDDPSGGGFPDERIRGMHRHLAAMLASRDSLDLRVARSRDGEIVGVIYNFVHGGTLYYYHMGARHDDGWGNYSLGTCLLADSISAALERGLHTFDLLRGDHEYKHHFGGYTTNNLRVIVYRYGWLPRAESTARALRRKLKGTAPMQLEAGH
jgi:CelD/BcsL family acetyltransferase involved in cellulose biosynthesis